MKGLRQLASLALMIVATYVAFLVACGSVAFLVHAVAWLVGGALGFLGDVTAAVPPGWY